MVRSGRCSRAGATRGWPGRSRPFLLAACLLAFVLAPASARAQGAQGGSVAGVLRAEAAEPQPRVRAEDLARVLGATLSEDRDLLVLRLEGRALTLFAGSIDALVANGTALEETLSAPALRRPDGWWLPLDAGAFLGLVREGEERVRGPDGRSWRLAVAAPPVRPASPRAEVVNPAPGVRGLQLYAPGPHGGADGLALWVSDLSLAALVVPEARAVLDAALARAGSQRALLLIATSLTPGARVEGPALYTDDSRRVAPGERLEVLSGSAEAVGPERPWVAVMWLPPGVRLDRPVRVVWRGAEAEIVFRE